MPRPVRSQGRPGTPVIPAGWEGGHQPVVAKTLSAMVAIRLPSTKQAWNETEEAMVAVPQVPYYTDTARIQILQARDQNPTVAEDPETISGYLVVIPADVTPPAQGSFEGHLIEVTDSTDPLLDGRVLIVREVVRGSLRFERDLFCELAA